jgi:hypothetical protein
MRRLPRSGQLSPQITQGKLGLEEKAAVRQPSWQDPFVERLIEVMPLHPG